MADDQPSDVLAPLPDQADAAAPLPPRACAGGAAMACALVFGLAALALRPADLDVEGLES